MIFFHDRQWYRPEPLFSVEEEEEEEELEEEAQLAPTEEVQQTDISQDIPPATSQETITPVDASSSTKKPDYEFLLFNYLLRFVHREGKIGDFARAGVLFLMDVAMSPIDAPIKAAGGESLSSSTSTTLSDSDANNDGALALAEYILDGDFSEVLAAGLAAVYSLLPSKLEIRPPAQLESTPTSGMILGTTTMDMTDEEKEKLELEREKGQSMGLEESSSTDFKGRLDHFLKLVEFLQDILRRNIVNDLSNELDASTLVGSAIVQSILDAVRRVFLENVLYPSILECADSDGSAVAVMSYIEIMIRTLDNGQLGDLLVDFLTSEDNTEDFTRSRMRPHSLLELGGSRPPTTGSTRATKLRRRKSAAMALLEMEAPSTRRQSEYFTSMGRFTLKDLLLSSLRSSSQPAVTAALQLLQSMVQQYCKLSAEKLLIVIHDPHATSFPQPMALPAPLETSAEDDDDETFIYPGAEDTKPSSDDPLKATLSLIFPEPDTTFWTHEREMGLYLSLVSRVDPNHSEDAFSTGYDHYLRDALFSIQSQQCYQLNMDEEARAKSKHRLNPHDPMLVSVLDSLRQFFANTPELNMALTGVLATLAVCPDRSLAGWLTFAPKENDELSSSRNPEDFMDFKDDGDDRSIDWRIEEKLASESDPRPASSLDELSRPVVHTIFHGLVSQLERYRQSVDDFDRFLLERRQGLLFSENLADALTLALELDSTSMPSVLSPSSTTPESTTPKPKPKAKSSSSFVSFLTPKKNKSSKPQRADSTSTPRGHKLFESSPFAPHYQKTSSVVVEPFAAPAPSNGPWTPTKSRKWDEEDVFASAGQWGDAQTEIEVDTKGRYEEPRTKPAHVTLSRLLDNVVILEESIKELAAIIHARRSLGVDSIRYL
ncbi:hypothetical protein EW026_g1265 [Hermanssonia centrifuga]|uniref:FHF complex subunit HOOK-interacting protein C-terminal domain-containing protein n=1 Tax=Hermanssonia centrifuga TaxID=98765 RepID=A0A4S4KRZ1_9APHY|nr:hypothetical protein EW026_g1265 [Hermanssonia centrifuga]